MLLISTSYFWLADKVTVFGTCKAVPAALKGTGSLAADAAAIDAMLLRLLLMLMLENADDLF
jgi:hypothetical protein